MPRKTDRNFLPDFAALDIEYLPKKGPDVSDDIQMVYVLGSTATLVAPAFSRFESRAPTIMPSYGFTAVGPGPNRAILQLLAGPTGFWWTGVFMGTATGDFSVSFWTEAALRVLTTQTDVDPITAANSGAWGDGRDATAVARFGDNAVLASRPAQSWQARGSNTGEHTGVLQNLEPTYIGPGRNLIMMHNANGSQNLGFYWREPLTLP